MPRRLAALACVLALTASAVSASGRPEAVVSSRVVDVDPSRPVLTGAISTDVTLAPDRIAAGGRRLCAAFAIASADAARARAESLAKALGLPRDSPAMLGLALRQRPIDSPLPPSCHSDFTFVQRMAFDVPAARPDAFVPILWAGPSAPVALRVRANGPLLTVDGTAVLVPGDRGSSDACAIQGRVIRAALADAAERARRVATALSTAFDPHPIAVAIQHGTTSPVCSGPQRALRPEAQTRHIAGNYVPPPSYTGDEVGIVATFRIGRPTLSGATRLEPASDGPASFAVQFGYVPAPISYPAATLTGDATREARLRPDDVAIEFRVAPDHHDGFRPIDPAAVSAFASLFGLSPASYTAAFEPGTISSDVAGVVQPDVLDIQATVPYRGATTQGQLDSLGRAAQGYPTVRALARSTHCAGAEVQVATEAIRAAAAAALVTPDAKVIAIDLRGPFVVSGTCLPLQSAPPVDGVAGRVTIPEVRLAAYARVSFAAHSSPQVRARAK